MSDYYYALTVVLEKDIKDEYCENLINAIIMMKGVLEIKPNISNPSTWMAESRAKHELGMKIIKVIKESQ